MKNSWLNEKTLVITGASSGLGKELTKMLITNNGCRVIGIGRSKDKFDAFKKELGPLEEMLTVELFDVTDISRWEEFALKYTQIDGLINCAGILPPFKRATDTPIELTKTVLEADYLACVYSINALFRALSASKAPMIVNVSSSAALLTIAGTSAYSAAKSALKSYTEALAVELKGKFYVSLVMPGFAKTDIFRSQKAGAANNKLVDSFSMPAEKMAKKIYRGLLKQRKRMVLGKDAHLMDLYYRLFPKSAPAGTSAVIKSAKTDLFSDVFEK